MNKLARRSLILVDRNLGKRPSFPHGRPAMNLMVARLKKESKVEVVLDTPRIAYRETINGIGTAQFRHKKESGGHGQFAEVHLRLEPYTPEEGGDEYVFANEVVGGNIPKNFIPAIEKGVIETRLAGPLSRSKVINFKATVYDGKYHDVDSSEMAFESRGAVPPWAIKADVAGTDHVLKIIFPKNTWARFR